MKRFYKILTIVAVNIVLCFLVTEALGIISYYWQHGQLFYTRRAEGKSENESITAADLRELKSKHSFHPFLGYIQRPSLKMEEIIPQEQLERALGKGSIPRWYNEKANNFGFFSDQDYPYKKRDDNTYIIGIFGGSVAHWLVSLSSEDLKRHLQASSVLRGKEIRILNFSQGGYKQPSQLLTLAYFLAIGQHFDFVVNVDGFNEIALSYLNLKKGIDPSMPFYEVMLPLASLIDQSSLELDQIDSLYDLEHRRETLRIIDSWIHRNDSAAVNMFLEMYRKIVTQKYTRSLQQFEELSTHAKKSSFFHINDILGNLSQTKDLSYLLDIWANSSIMMGSILSKMDIPYLEIIQPNQYFSSKVFSSEEKAVALDSKSPFKWPIETGYRLILQRIPLLQKSGVNVVSAVDIFDNIPETLFFDNCCHYNQLGNDILAEFIAKEIIALINKKHDKAF
jgi:hypothetical protein